MCRTSLPELLGMPADLRGAESSTSGVNFARMVIMKAVRKLSLSHTQAVVRCWGGERTEGHKNKTNKKNPNRP